MQTIKGRAARTCGVASVTTWVPIIVNVPRLAHTLHLLAHMCGEVRVMPGAAPAPFLTLHGRAE